jgi:DNA-binding response OmpR family regulator
MENTRRKILIIEDDRFISEMYARTLTKSGFEVVESTNGPDGFALAKQGGWSYILLDIMLPDKTGVEILQELRTSGEEHKEDGTKIVVMTNFEQDDATRESMEKLADGYLIKAEITPRRLAEIIQEMEQQQAAPPDTK